MKRRKFFSLAAASFVCACSGGKIGGGYRFHSWGGQGIRDGNFIRPRAVTVTGNEVFVGDTTGRIQVFSMDGKFLRKWSMPQYENGTPTGIAFDRTGTAIVPDTHYSRVIEFKSSGEIIKMWGTYGTGNEQFIYPTDAAQGPDGNLYFSEYGIGAERIHVFDAERRFVRQWGEHGQAPGQLNRAMSLAIDKNGTVLVADTANHRIQCFDLTGKLIRIIGAPGAGAGQLKFPQDIAIAPDGTILVCEYGAHRISRFKIDGTFLCDYGKPGRNSGEFNSPRGIAVSSDGVAFVADTDNHRVQSFRIAEAA